VIGKVLDASALAAWVRGSIAANAWLGTAYALTSPLYILSLAFTEVRAVRPYAGPNLAELLGHPSVLVGELSAADAAAVDLLLEAAGVFDALAGQVVHVAAARGWPALTADPGRLQRIDPNIVIDLI